MNAINNPDTVRTEWNRDLFEFFGNWLLGVVVLFLIVLLLLAVAGIWRGWHEQRQRAGVEAELRRLAASDGTRPAIRPQTGVTVWRFRLRRWSFALSIDRVENTV